MAASPPTDAECAPCTRATLGLAGRDAPFDWEFGTAGQIYVSTVWDNRIRHLTGE